MNIRECRRAQARGGREPFGQTDPNHHGQHQVRGVEVEAAVAPIDAYYRRLLSHPDGIQDNQRLRHKVHGALSV